MNFELILSRNLPHSFNDLSTEEKIKEIEKLDHIYLDRENLSKIENLDFLSINVTHIYLQNNKIEKIENLECLRNLRCLILSNNLLNKIENIKHLKRLQSLDVSNNEIVNISPDEIPRSLVTLNIKGNPLILSDKLQPFNAELPLLIVLDDADVKKSTPNDGHELTCDDDEIGENVMAMLNRSQQRVENNYRQRLAYNDDILEMKDRLKQFIQS